MLSAASPLRSLVACIIILAIALLQIACELHIAPDTGLPQSKDFFLPTVTDTTILRMSPDSSILQISFSNVYAPAQGQFLLTTTPIISYIYDQHISAITITLTDNNIQDSKISLRLINTQTSVISDYSLIFDGAKSVYFQPGEKVSICRKQQREDKSSCKICDKECLTCYGEAEYCTSCVKPLYAKNGQCINQINICSNGYYQRSGVCQACSMQCLTCSNNQDNCTSCAYGKYVDRGLCKRCDKSCYICSEEAQNCITCAEGYQKIAQLPRSKCATRPSISSERLLIGNSQLICDPNCQKCQGISTNCTQCVLQKYLIQGKCQYCDRGLYSSRGSCLPCNTSCLSCVSKTECRRCVVGLHLQNKECVRNCSTGYFLNVDTCLKCDAQCVTCVGTVVNCTSCAVGKFLTSGQCQACDQSCAKCTGSATNCTQCISYMFLVKGACLSCDQGFFQKDLNNCVECPKGCLTCQKDKICSRCNTSYLLVAQDCLADCLGGFYLNISSLTCQKCDSNCLNCSLSVSNCTSCLSSQFQLDGICIDCDFSCRACSGTSKNCLSCAFDYQNISLLPGICQSFCPPSNFQIGQLCSPCNKNCQTCSVIANNCTSCQNNLVLTQGSCIPCAAGTFYSNISKDCQACNLNCLSCVSKTECTRCVAGLYLQNQGCVSNCSAGYFFNNDTCKICDPKCVSCEGTSTNCSSCTTMEFVLAGKCQKCDVSCSQCMGAAESCISCAIGYSNASALPGVCQLNCETNAYLSGKACAPCSSGCLTCAGTASNCTSCAQLLYLVQGACLSCNQGFYFDGLNSCDKCPKGCLACQKDKTCSRCSGGYILNNASCVSTCSADSFFNNNNACQICDPKCFTCEGTSTNCTSCSAAEFLLGGKCQACDVSCTKCTGVADSCLSCAANYSNASSFPGVCLPKCGPKFFLSGKICVACSYNCLTCAGAASNCTSCDFLLYLVQGECLDCQQGSFLNEQRMCRPCPNGCLTCYSDGTCSRCGANFTLTNNTCISLCPAGYFTNNISKCQICNANCLTCVVASNNCSSCPSNSSNPYLFLFKCVSACPAGTTPLGGKCVPSYLQSSSAQSLILPFPICLVFAILGGTSIISKALISKTLLVSCLCAFAGILEFFSWVVAISLLYSLDNTDILPSMCLYSFISASFILFLLNSINLYLFRRYIFEDEKFRRNYQTLKSSKLKLCMFHITVGFSLFASHKFIEILFSNYAKLKLFTFKVKTIHKLSPQKYIRIISLFPSLIAIGASAILYLQFKQSQGYLYWEALDIMAISTLSAITSIWVTRRKPEHFQNSVVDKSLDMQNYNVGDDPAPEIHFQELRKEQQPFGPGNNLQSYKNSVNTTEQNLINRNHKQRSEDQNFYNQIHVAAREKDGQGQLNETRLTYNGNSRRKSNDSIENSNHDSLNQEIPPMKSIRQVKKRRRSSRGRQRNRRFIQEEKNPIHLIQASFTQKQIQLMRVIRKADEVATQVNETIRQELRNSQHRLKPNGELYEILNFLMNLNDNEVGVLQKRTRLTLQGLQQTILRLQSAKILPEEFLDYLNQIDQQKNSCQKQNYPHSHSPVPPLPKHIKSGELRKNKSSNSRIAIHGDKVYLQLRRQTCNHQSPLVNQFNHSPLRANKQDADHISLPQQYNQAEYLKYPPHPRRGKTPKSYEVQYEVREPDNQEAVDMSLRPYQKVVSRFNHKKPRSSSLERPTTEQKEQQSEGKIEGRDEVHLEDGLSSLKKEASGLKQNKDASPPNPFITLSRLQQIDSFTFTDQVDGLQINGQFAGGDSVAQVMNKYSKNSQKQQEDCDEIPDQDDDKFKRLRRKRHGRRQNSTNGE